MQTAKPAICIFTTAVVLLSLGSTTIAGQSPSDTATPIKHLVVIFQENVSFDHYFATYPNAANPGGEPLFFAREGRRGKTSVNGLSGPLLTANPNSVQPFRLDRSQAILCDQSHDYTAEQKAMDGGLMDKFVELNGGTPQGGCNDVGAGKGLVMGYYDGNTVTAVWNYAQHFAMSDSFFSTNFGPSTLGHLNLVSGQTNGATIVHDSGNASSAVIDGTVIGDIRPAFDDCIPAGANTISMRGSNIGDLLNRKGITWGWFQGGFAPSSRNADASAVCATKHSQFDGTASQADYVSNHNPFQFYQSTSNPHHLPATSAKMIGQQDQANHQYDIADFFNALNAGILPAVTFLKAPSYQDGHAQYSNPLDEQAYLVNTINALEQSPFWDSTAVIIAYDDSDGWYDHVMPPIVMPSVSPADALSGPGMCGNSAEFSGPGGRCGYGQRLPLLLISPFAAANFVDHSLTDQTSILRLIEDNWNLGPIGGSSFDAMAGSLWNLFEFDAASDGRKLFLDPSTGEPL
ncbi:MAG TPA: alkaline phosphatase family protein [Bryobacteraceae bacterium]|nr:alkaline phosphatase family protein [Bryobacteraceae bacterium]